MEGRRFYVGGFDPFRDFDVIEFKAALKCFTNKPALNCIQIFYEHSAFNGYIAITPSQYLDSSDFSRKEFIFHERRLFVVEIQRHRDNKHKYLELALRESS